MQRLLTGEHIDAKLERWRATADARELQINLSSSRDDKSPGAGNWLTAIPPSPQKTRTVEMIHAPATQHTVGPAGRPMRGRWADHAKCLWPSRRARTTVQGAREGHAPLVMITSVTGGQTLCGLLGDRHNRSNESRSSCLTSSCGRTWLQRCPWARAVYIL